ncbi:porin family protein [Chitinophaga agrisoli]|nr:porin family protein [Chitinophaga agrisoli]
MKNFTCLLLLAVVASLPLRAQISVGFRGGYSFATMRYDDPTIGYKNNGIGSPSAISSWHADFILDMPVGHQGFYLQPVFRYITKGANFEQPSTRPTGVYLPSANKITLHYLELPVNLLYKLPVSFGKITAGAGPYIGYGLSGKYNVAISYDDGKVLQNNEQSIDFQKGSGILSTNTQLRRWDAGANFMVGVEFNSLIVIGANYSLGLTDLDKSSVTSLKNSYLGVSLGVILNREDY